MSAPQVVRVLKQDAFGRVERVDGAHGPLVRRVARGGFPGAGWIARALLARERRALSTLAGLVGVAQLIERDGAGSSAALGERADETLLRSWIPGRPLCEAEELPRDFFERLEELVRELHLRGVCHNDLHKEGNVLVGEDGYPWLVDFQLASVHARRGRTFAVRAREDLRHVWKHRSLYFRALGESDPLGGVPPRRSLLAEIWRRSGKPLYNLIASGVRFVARSNAPREQPAAGEVRRPEQGPWPRWSRPVGPRSATCAGNSPGAPSPAR